MGRPIDRAVLQISVSLIHIPDKIEENRKKHTPIGIQVRKNVNLVPFSMRPEYLTTLWMVNAGNPILATLWKTARLAITIR